jgi:nucleotide-binding universal stress UspA family protein
MFRYKHILIPLDGSELAETALEPALSLAQLMEAQVTLIQVIPPFIREVDEQYAPMALDILLEKAGAYLLGVRQRLAAAHDSINIEIASGQVAETIIAYAEEQGVDLIVISSHGRSGIGRWVFGSVAERVLRGAPCATLIIHQRKK